MKQIILTLLLISGLWSCSDDEVSIIMTNLPEDAFVCKPISGGAVMHYTLPSDPNIVGISVRYQDAYGQEMLQGGSCNCDSLILIGFNEAQKDVLASVTLDYYNGSKSQTFEVRFDTEDSAPVVFMETLKCYGNWEGFVLEYEIPREASGMAHVFYVGENPQSHLPDTLLIDSFFLEDTEDEAEFSSYKMKQTIESPTVVVRVEDFRGYMINEKVWKNVPNMVMEKLDKQYFDFYCDNSQEDKEYKLGVEYLFDGDTKGEVCFEDGKYHSFLAGPDAAGENARPMYIDVRGNRIVASVRIYNLLKNTSGINWYQGKASICYSYNDNEIPCKITIYGLKDKGIAPVSYEDFGAWENSEWEKIGSFEEDKNLANAERWCKHAWFNGDWSNRGFTLKELKEADEEYIDVVVPAYFQGDGYRYLKIVIDRVFEGRSELPPVGNVGKYVQFHELEVYTDKN